MVSCTISQTFLQQVTGHCSCTMQGTHTFRVTQLFGGQGVQHVVAHGSPQLLPQLLPQVLPQLLPQPLLHRLLRPLQKALKAEYSSRHS